MCILFTRTAREQGRRLTFLEFSHILSTIWGVFMCSTLVFGLGILYHFFFMMEGEGKVDQLAPSHTASNIRIHVWTRWSMWICQIQGLERGWGGKEALFPGAHLHLPKGALPCRHNSGFRGSQCQSHCLCKGLILSNALLEETYSWRGQSCEEPGNHCVPWLELPH